MRDDAARHGTGVSARHGTGFVSTRKPAQCSLRIDVEEYQSSTWMKSTHLRSTGHPSSRFIAHMTPFPRPRVDGPPPRTAERRGPASRSRNGRAGESAAGGRAGGGDAVPCQMFHVRCAWDVGHEAAAGRAEGGWEHGWGRVERLPERCPSKKLQACTIKAQDDGLRHIK